MAKGLYLAAVIILSCINLHPVMLAISFAGGFFCLWAVCGYGRMLRQVFFFSLPGVIVLTLVNVLFNHYGVTVLFYFPGGNACTLESVLYGLALSVVIMNVLLWCAVLSAVMDAEAFMYVFGRIGPNLCMALTLSLRFIPLIADKYRRTALAKRQFETTRRAGRMGRFGDRLLFTSGNISSVIQRALEGSVETADVMRSRGFGTGRRAVFSLFFMSKRDWAVMGFTSICFVVVVAAIISGGFAASYDPVVDIRFDAGDVTAIAGIICFAALSIFPGAATFAQRRLNWAG